MCLDKDETKPGVYKLKPPFIKVEDMSRKYRPLVIQDMKNWPMTISDYVDYFNEQDRKKKLKPRNNNSSVP